MASGADKSHYSRLLVVDDDANQLRTLTRIFEAEGFDVLGCATGTEALGCLGDGDIGVAIVDLRLPDLSDSELLARLEPLSGQVRIIIHTAYSSYESARDAVNLGAFAYIEKGTDPDELIHQVYRAFRAQLEWELRASEAKYRTICEQSFDGIVTIDAHGTFTDVSPAVERISGYTADQAIGQHFRMFLSEEDVPTAYEAFREVMRGRLLKDVELRGRRSDGSRFDVELNAVPVVADGKVLEAQAVFRDITQRKRAEHALQAARDRAQQYLDIAGVMFVALDSDGKITLANRCVCQVLGYRENQLVGKDWFNTCLPSGMRSKVRRVYDRLMAGEVAQSKYHENPVLTKTGEERIVAWHNTVVRDSCNQIVGTLSSGDDITERKEAEREKDIRNRALQAFLAESNQDMYDEVLKTILSAFESEFGVVGYIDEKGDLVCPSMTSHVWDQCQMPGKGVVFPKDAWGDSIWGNGLRTGKSDYSNEPFQVPQGHIPIENCLTAPLAFGDKSIGLLTVANKQDGYDEADRRFLETLAKSVAPVLNARLARKRAEEALRRSQEEFRRLFHEAPVGYHELDTEARIVRVNQTELEMLGYTADEMLGRPVWEFCSAADQSQQAVRAKLSGTVSAARTFERLYRCKDGTLLPVLIEDRLLRDAAGQITGIRSTLQDITKRKRMEAELRQREKELAHLARVSTMGEMATGLAHELNQPLYAITNYAKGIIQHLRTATTDAGDLTEVMDKIARQARRASDVIQRFRGFVKKREPHRSTTDLSQLVKDLLKLLEHELRQSGVSVELDLAGQLPAALVDSVQIEQVLVNLIRNALDAMRDMPSKGRRLTLTTSAADDQTVEVGVADTGIGLSTEVQSKLFEAFYTTKADGLGMGLAIGRTIVEAHGGRIWAAPNSPHGTVFRLSIPILEREVTHAT